ncbi:MAG: Rpn family recombination-promoting nuclease/putative transposase, partial [bacterium]
MKKDLANIHNNFFLQLLSKKQNTIDFLKISLPKEIFEQIDFDYLDFDKQTHILPKLKSSMKDLIIKTKLKNKKEVDFYLLLEHKSSIDNDKPKDVFIQIFKYIFNIIFEDYKNNKELRVVIPLVFYHGEKEWKIPTNFKDIFDVSDSIKQNLIDFNYILFNTKDDNSINK